ncbi:to methyltransferase, partial [Aspergillus sclerotialis]
MNNLKPGGYAEIVDHPTLAFSDDDSMDRAPNVSEWARLLNEAGKKFGKRMDIAYCQKQWMIDAGFKNVKEEIFK